MLGQLYDLLPVDLGTCFLFWFVLLGVMFAVAVIRDRFKRPRRQPNGFDVIPPKNQPPGDGDSGI